MKKILGILLLFITFGTFHASAQPLNTSFDDDGFYRCIINHLNDQYINNQNNRVAESYTVTDEELESLKSLTCISYNIKSTKGIEKLSQVEYFDFEDNRFKSIDLSKNSEATYLYVDKEVNVIGYNGKIERESEIEKQNNEIPTSMIIIGIIGILIYIIYSIELACIFSKLSEKKWKAWIPILNQITLVKASGLSILYFVLLLIPPINFFAMYKIGAQLCVEFNKSKIIAIIFMLIEPLGLLLLLIPSKQKNNIKNNSDFQNVENQIPNIMIQNQPIIYNNQVGFDMMPIPNETINEIGIPEVNQVPNMQPSMNEINQVPNMQPNMNEVNQVPNMQPSMNEINQVPNMQPSMNEINQVPNMQPGVNEINQVPNMQNKTIPKPNDSNVDLEYKICPICQNRLRSDAKTCFMCGSLVD